jgi:hypothetical protein
MAAPTQGTSNSNDGYTPKGIVNSAFHQLDPSKYTALDEFIDEVNAPDVRANLIKAYGDQGITGFLKLTGAVNAAGTADQVTYWEEARLHQPQTISPASQIAGGATQTIPTGDVGPDDDYDNAEHRVVRAGDVLLHPIDGDPVYVSSVSATDNSFTIAKFGSGTLSAITAATHHMPIVGNIYAQGTDQPTAYLQSNVVKRTNDYQIVKEIYKVSGSQATNVGYIDLGGGDYRWYIKSEQDTRQRFLDKREMMMLLGAKVANTGDITGTTGDTFAARGITGSEGYFEAIRDRGLVSSTMGSLADDLDELIKALDKNGAPSEYAVYANTATFLGLDNMISSIGGDGGGLVAAYGAFNNDKNMAVNLGFQSFGRAGYTFHKHSWNLLNDPTLLGAAGNTVKGVMVPIANVTDARTGAKAPALEMNYKATNGYSREMEHWVTGGGVLGFTNDTKDVAQFNYRSECCLVTRAANQHVLIGS